MKMELITVVRWNSLTYKVLMEDGFTKFGYGDADDTLMHPCHLIAELERSQGASTKFELLIEELNSVPAGVLVSFEC